VRQDLAAHRAGPRLLVPDTDDDPVKAEAAADNEQLHVFATDRIAAGILAPGTSQLGQTVVNGHPVRLEELDAVRGIERILSCPS
jgi:hypothetical protein